MKTILYFSLSVLIVILLCKSITSQQVVTEKTMEKSTDPKVIILRGRVAGDWKSWLKIETFNSRDFPVNGFDPTYTHLVSDYKPMFRRLQNGQWEIMWTSEIAENLP